MTYQLIHGDCMEVLPTLEAGSIDAVVTDPPYPDIDKGFAITSIEFLASLPCRQFVFWSAVHPFPLSYTAIHIWHKPNGNSSQHYERIFERNGGAACRVFRLAAILPNYIQYRSECVAHPTQKPLSLMRRLVRNVPKGSTILDPFMGSGSTIVAAIMEGRNAIGVELDKGYYDIAVRRCADAAAQPRLLDVEPLPQAKQSALLEGI